MNDSKQDLVNIPELCNRCRKGIASLVEQFGNDDGIQAAIYCENDQALTVIEFKGAGVDYVTHIVGPVPFGVAMARAMDLSNDQNS